MTETVPFDHAGAHWDIPADLIELQRAWDAAAAACRALAESGDDAAALNGARAHRLDLAGRLHEHPWLLAAMADGRRHQADLALKACARGR